MDNQKFKTPLISIVMPVYNVDKYIHASLKSVLEQTYKSWELILVDDGSTDNSPEICDNFAKEFGQITVVHRTNGGQAAARNSGLTAAHGKYIFFLDSDDVIQPDTLQRFDDVISEYGDQDLIFTRFQRVHEGNIFKAAIDDDGVELFSEPQNLQRGFLLRTHIILAPGTLYRIEWLKLNNLVFQQIPYSEDQLFIWKALLYVKKAAYIRRSLYNYLDRSGSIMTATKPETIIKSYPAFCELENIYSHSEIVPEDVRKYILPRWIFGIARSGSKLSSYEEYKDLLDRIEVNRHFKALKTFPDYKVRTFLLLWKLSRRLFYKVCKHT